MPRGNWGTDEVHLHHRVGVLTRSNCADSRTQLYLTPASWETSQVSPPTQLLVNESGFKFKNPPGFKTPHIITDPTNSIYSDWRERGRKKYKTKNKQKTPKCFNSAWVVTILSIITREICIYFFVPFSLSFFFCEVKSKLLFALKKKKKKPTFWKVTKAPLPSGHRQNNAQTLTSVLHRWFCVRKASSFNTNYRTVFSGNKKSRSEKAVTHKSINTRTLIFSLQ